MIVFIKMRNIIYLILALMRDPILQEKRQEHVTFQKYALDLLLLLSGKTARTDSELYVSLPYVRRANVVAQTKIMFNDKQLLQLIHQHLVCRGLQDAASALLKEANLSAYIPNVPTHQPSKFRYTLNSPSAPSRVIIYI